MYTPGRARVIRSTVKLRENSKSPLSDVDDDSHATFSTASGSRRNRKTVTGILETRARFRRDAPPGSARGQCAAFIVTDFRMSSASTGPDRNRLSWQSGLGRASPKVIERPDARTSGGLSRNQIDPRRDENARGRNTLWIPVGPPPAKKNPAAELITIYYTRARR